MAGRSFCPVPARVTVPTMRKTKARLTECAARLNLHSGFYSQQLRAAYSPLFRRFQLLASLQETGAP